MGRDRFVGWVRWRRPDGTWTGWAAGAPHAADYLAAAHVVAIHYDFQCSVESRELVVLPAGVPPVAVGQGV